MALPLALKNRLGQDRARGVAGAKDEKIDGDKATLQVKNDKDAWESINLVKEDGEWKMK